MYNILYLGTIVCYTLCKIISHIIRTYLTRTRTVFKIYTVQYALCHTITSTQLRVHASSITIYLGTTSTAAAVAVSTFGCVLARYIAAVSRPLKSIRKRPPRQRKMFFWFFILPILSRNHGREADVVRPSHDRPCFIRIVVCALGRVLDWIWIRREHPFFLRLQCKHDDIILLFKYIPTELRNNCCFADINTI